MDRSHARDGLFDVEWETLETALDTELASQANRFVVVAGTALIGIFDTYGAALEAGYRTCGFSPFLLKRLPPAGGSLTRRPPPVRSVERRRDRRVFQRSLKFLIARLGS